ncbi:mannonate dehydratase [Pedobacter psychrophilus]|uniref:Mannonate dehydratase n=1 Tax=Pedobacter psychrophilus TaxID=1826909 RepID=A0A179DNA9_9SPHI|nr:mannonate dehydratase [Pedobacter psychrophilus]OAQ42039.1 mannonate dehydratase [Pedobacter psychrophilus]
MDTYHQKLEQTFRWFGPADEVTLADILQTGATGVVTALHQIPCGDVWTDADILDRKEMIENAGLKWSIVESVNIHESIKTGTSERDNYIEIYKTTLKNLAKAGIKVVCYNFMPVLDWTRTHLRYTLKDKAEALRYDAIALAAFDLYILERKEAFNEFSEEVQNKAKIYLSTLSKDEVKTLTETIMTGLPGTDEVFTIPEFYEHLDKYANVGKKELRENLAYFLKGIIPTAEEEGIKMCIHPDDPPYPILGLPRIVCNEEDLQFIVDAVDSDCNGITFCTGSLGANPANDLPAMIERLGHKIHFWHLRNVQREENGSFYEAPHLEGSNSMYAIMKAVITEQEKRATSGKGIVNIPMRPDHGHLILDDIHRNTYPGYSVIGRLKGLAELRGLEMGIRGY